MSENLSEHSNQIISLNEAYIEQAETLVNNLWPKGEDVFIGLDCLPNGRLNPINFSNGFESAMTIKELAASFLSNELPWFEQKMAKAQNTKFTTDFSLGEKNGLWKRIRPNDYEAKLNWNEAFCLKNKSGLTKIWHPNWRILGHNQCFSTQSAIVRFINEYQVYKQSFYMPLPAPNMLTAWKMYYRLVFSCSTEEKKPELIGGLWISRRGYKVYPGRGSVIGLISPLPSFAS
jgi:hypothetical protein